MAKPIVLYEQVSYKQDRKNYTHHYTSLCCMEYVLWLVFFVVGVVVPAGLSAAVRVGLIGKNSDSVFEPLFHTVKECCIWIEKCDKGAIEKLIVITFITEHIRRFCWKKSSHDVCNGMSREMICCILLNSFVKVDFS